MSDKAIEAALEAFWFMKHRRCDADAMRAAILAYEQALWQPIENAPKDGTRFIAYQPRIGICVCKRHDPGGATRNPSHHYECWITEGQEGYPWHPTHCRPLPPPPGKER